MVDTACRLFYAEGIHAVGVDRIATEARVTRATFCRYFPSKDDLVLVYLGEADAAMRQRVDEAVAAGLPAADTIRALSKSVAGSVQSPGYRGCAFLNAVAEFPNPEHPVHVAVLAHRQWFLDKVTELLADIRETPAEAAAHHFVMMRDGATVVGCLFDPGMVRNAFLRGVEGLLRRHVASDKAELADI
ncbi:TetR/AcrR family transcriptional regulator [Streptomyces sp. NPDC093586]|uniref:TetR/AcrR family transcriptional regulator n=1 Tax=Streptomyces sp. NPDC093586 TaxID=3366042 RepID=UPI0038190508